MKTLTLLFLSALFLLIGCTATTAVSTPTPIPPPQPTATITTNDAPAKQPLGVSITAVSTHDVSRNLPAYLTYSTTGDDLTNISLVARGDDGRLLTHQFINGGDMVFWNGTANYIHDGLGDGAFVLTKRADNGQIIAPGRYQRAGESHSVMAELYFDGDSGNLLQATQFPTTGNRTPINLPINAGGRFTFDWLYEFDGAPVLTINPTGLLYFEERELTNGRYQLGLIAENSAGEAAETFASVNAHHRPISGTNPTHIDPYHAVAFAYPDGWTEPTSGGIVQTGNISNSVTAAISFHRPLPSGGNALSLKQDALHRFGGVHLLFEEEIVLGERRGLRTVYGYEDAAGELHTGVLLTAVNDNIGIVIDIDGAVADEAETIAAAALLQESWQFLPTRIDP